MKPKNMIGGGGYTQLDVLKFLLAILILLRHCGQGLFEPSSMFMRIMNVVSPLGVPIFFTISGFLFFNKERNSNSLWKYVWRVSKLYLVWTIIYLPLIFRSYQKNGMLNAAGMLDFAQQFLFSGSFYHLWFLPSLIAAIIFVYFISKKIDNYKLLIISVVLFIVGTLVDTYSFLSPVFTWKAYKAIFLTTRNGLFFGIPYVAIGKIIADNKCEIKRGMMLLSITAVILEGYYLSFVVDKPIVNMSLSSLFFVPTLVIFALNLPPIKIDGKLLRKASTLIFCAHPISITLVGHFTKGLTGTLMVLMVSVVFSLMGAKLSERIKAINLLM